MDEKITLSVMEMFVVADLLKTFTYNARFPLGVSWRISELVGSLEKAERHVFERLDMVLDDGWQTAETLDDAQQALYDTVMSQQADFGDKIAYDWGGWTADAPEITPEQAATLRLVFMQSPGKAD